MRLILMFILRNWVLNGVDWLGIEKIVDLLLTLGCLKNASNFLTSLPRKALHGVICLSVFIYLECLGVFDL
jgi:hypothetical protein